MIELSEKKLVLVVHVFLELKSDKKLCKPSWFVSELPQTDISNWSSVGNILQ